MNMNGVALKSKRMFLISLGATRGNNFNVTGSEAITRDVSSVPWEYRAWFLGGREEWCTNTKKERFGNKSE